MSNFWAEVANFFTHTLIVKSVEYAENITTMCCVFLFKKGFERNYCIDFYLHFSFLIFHVRGWQSRKYMQTLDSRKYFLFSTKQWNIVFVPFVVWNWCRRNETLVKSLVVLQQSIYSGPWKEVLAWNIQNVYHSLRILTLYTKTQTTKSLYNKATIPLNLAPWRQSDQTHQSPARKHLYSWSRWSTSENTLLWVTM